VARLSSFITDEVDLVKLDVEGAEWGVLEDLVGSGAAGRVRRMIIEYHHHIERREDALGDFLNLLVRGGFGYQIGAYYNAPVNEAAEPAYQDVQIHAYRRPDGPGSGS
jgi:hypothetical protein